MPQARGPGRALALVILLSMSAGPSIAQEGPVAAMFAFDQKRDASFASSFLTTELPPTVAAAFAASVYLSAGDLERAFDRPEFRPDAAIVPTNTELLMTARAPQTQRVLISRVQKQADVMRDLNEQIAARRRQPAGPSGLEPGLMRIGMDVFVAQLPRRPAENQRRAFPAAACLIATDYPKGGAVDRRELFSQARVRAGIAECLAALDGAGAKSLVLPLMGAASGKIQGKDAAFEGQRILKECRLINAAAGIALGIHDFAPRRRSLLEIGLVQWEREITDMFKAPKGSRAAESAESAYRQYAEQVQMAFTKGLAGEDTTSSDVFGSCSGIFNVP